MKSKIAVVLLLGLTVTSAVAQFDSPTDGLRPLGDLWRGPRLIGPPTLQYSAVPIEIVSLSLMSTGPVTPTPALLPGGSFNVGYNITGLLDLNPGGPTPFNGVALEHLTLVSDSGGVRRFDTEMLQLDLTGGGFLLRESPTQASRGETTITDLGGPGPFRIDSFFDVFTELSLDAGQTWGQQVGGPGHITNNPEPSTWAAIAAVGAIAGWRWWNHRRRA